MRKHTPDVKTTERDAVMVARLRRLWKLHRPMTQGAKVGWQTARTVSPAQRRGWRGFFPCRWLLQTPSSGNAGQSEPQARLRRVSGSTIKGRQMRPGSLAAKGQRRNKQAGRERRTLGWAQLFPSNWARYSVGDCPRIFLKTRLKWVRDWKPTSKAISLTRKLGLSSRFFDFSMRTRDR